MVKKFISVLSIVICLFLIFTMHSYAYESFNLNSYDVEEAKYVKNEILITVTEKNQGYALEKLINEYDILEYENLFSKTNADGSITSIYKLVIETEDIYSMCKRIAKNDGIESAEPNYIGELSDVPEISYSTPWYFESLGYNEFDQYILNNNVSLRDITIAVLDTGLDLSNSRLTSNLCSFTVDNVVYHGFNATTDPVSYDLTDLVGHGTGIVSAICSNQYDGRIMGANNNIKVLPVKVYTDHQSIAYSYEGIAISNVINAINNLVGDNKIVDVDIINLSSGFYLTDDLQSSLNSLKTAIDSATEEKIVFFASAGNENKSIYNQDYSYNYGNLCYPAAYDNVIGVMSCNSVGELSYFSNFGQSTGEGGYDLIAPGENILAPYYEYNKDFYLYAMVSGTSFASPIAASIVGLYLACLTPTYINNTSYSTLKQEIVSLFSTKEYGYKIKNTNDILFTEYIPTVNYFDILEYLNAQYSIPQQTLPNGITYSFSTIENKYVMSINCNTNCNIPDSISRFNTPWYGGNIENVEKIIINASDDFEIGDYSFSGFKNLKTVDFNISGDGSIQRIGKNAFSACASLNEIDLSNVENIGESAFAYCVELDEIDLSSAVSFSPFVFECCIGISEIESPVNNVAIPTGFCMFCVNLLSIDLSMATNIGEMAFSNCWRLEELVLPPNSETMSVNIGAYAFCVCDLPDIIIISSSIASVGDFAFYRSEAKYIVIDNFSVQLGTRCFQDLNDVDGYLFVGYWYSTAYYYIIDAYEGNIPFLEIPKISPVQGNNAVVDTGKEWIYGLQSGISTTQLLNNYISIAGNYEIEYVYSNTIGTGTKIKLKVSNGGRLIYEKEFTIIIFGDCDGNGTINSSDSAIAYQKAYSNIGLVEGTPYYYAADVTYFGNGINGTDVNAISQAAVGLIELSQNINYGGIDYGEED